MKIHNLSHALLRIFNIFYKDRCPLPWRREILILAWMGNWELPSCFKGKEKDNIDRKVLRESKGDAFRT